MKLTVTYGKGFEVGHASKVDFLESEFLKMSQVECPVVHRFGPGIYIREVTVPAGSAAIGHKQRFAQMNVFLRGRVTVVNDDGTHTELVAPMTFVGPPGRKVGYVHEDMVWQNVYATDETDIEKLESMFLDKSEVWQNSQPKLIAVDYSADFKEALKEFGFTEQQARDQSENESDQIPFPHGSYKVAVADSPIEGKGLFATASILYKEIIAPARINGFRTPAGRFTNHSPTPNAKMVWIGSDIYLMALTAIHGCSGGIMGEEITIDYRDALRLQIKEQ
jgi:hypothetical protein